MQKICFVCPHIYGYFKKKMGYTGGGAERQIYLLTQELKQSNAVHAVVGDYGQAKREVRDGIILHRAYPLQPRQNILQPLKHFALLFDAMRRADADVYVYRGSPRNAGFVYLCARILGKSWVYNIANDSNLTTRPDNLSWPVGRLFNRAVTHADGIIAQTPKQQRILANRFGVESTVVPNGYPTVQETPPYTEREYLLWVGRLDERQKRPHKLLDVAEASPDSEFRIIGPVEQEDPYHREISDRAETLSNVRLLGAVPPDEVHDHYRRAIALVNTSAYEGFPNTFLEAWRQGAPVASLDIDVSRFGEFQPEFAHGTMSELVETVKRLTGDIDYRREVGMQSRREFENKLDITLVSERYRDALLRAI